MALAGIGSWHIRFTNYATVHVTHKQEKVNSCGIACILMINFKMKKGLMATGVAAGAALNVVPVVGGYLAVQMSRQAVDYAVKTEPLVYKVYSDVVGSPYDGTAYTDGMKHPEVLKRLGCGNWETVFVGETGMGAAIQAAVAAGAPCIAHVVWQAGGAHFVVIDECVGSGTAVGMVNDPGDGEVHPTLLSPNAKVNYRGLGFMSGWIVRRK
jgi:hypothetical protein